MAEQRIIDGRGLLPPEPLELTLAALDALSADEELLLLLYIEPHPLYGILKQNGYRHTTSFRDDGTVEVRIRRA